MANIGTFSPCRTAASPARLRTLTLNVMVKLVPNEKGKRKTPPDYRLQVVGSVEIGAAWKKTSQADRPLLVGGPRRPLVPDRDLRLACWKARDGEHSLIWSRTKSE